jgi:hypothetical protein
MFLEVAIANSKPFVVFCKGRLGPRLPCAYFAQTRNLCAAKSSSSHEKSRIPQQNSIAMLARDLHNALIPQTCRLIATRELCVAGRWMVFCRSAAALQNPPAQLRRY